MSRRNYLVPSEKEGEWPKLEIKYINKEIGRGLFCTESLQANTAIPYYGTMQTSSPKGEASRYVVRINAHLYCDANPEFDTDGKYIGGFVNEPRPNQVANARLCIS